MEVLFSLLHIDIKKACMVDVYKKKTKTTPVTLSLCPPPVPLYPLLPVSPPCVHPLQCEPVAPCVKWWHLFAPCLYLRRPCDFLWPAERRCNIVPVSEGCRILFVLLEPLPLGCESAWALLLSVGRSCGRKPRHPSWMTVHPRSNSRVSSANTANSQPPTWQLGKWAIVNRCPKVLRCFVLFCLHSNEKLIVHPFKKSFTPSLWKKFKLKQQSMTIYHLWDG